MARDEALVNIVAVMQSGVKNWKDILFFIFKRPPNNGGIFQQYIRDRYVLL